MIVGLRLFCLVIVLLCHEGLPIKPLADSRIYLRMLKRSGLDWNDPRAAGVMFAGNDPLIGNEQRNGQLFRISKRKEQDSIIPNIQRKFHRFLLRYNVMYSVMNRLNARTNRPDDNFQLMEESIGKKPMKYGSKLMFSN